MDNIFFIFDLIDFIARLVIVVIFFFIASTLKKSNPDVIRSRLIIDYGHITKAFNMMFIGSIFFFVAALIEYFINPISVNDMFLIMKISTSVFQITVIYFIFTLNTVINAIGRRGM